MAALQVAVGAQIEVVGIIATATRVMPVNVIPVLAAALATATPRARSGQRQPLAVVRTRRAGVTWLPAHTTWHLKTITSCKTRRRVLATYKYDVLTA